MNLHGTYQSNVKTSSKFDKQKENLKVLAELFESVYIENNSCGIPSHLMVIDSFLVQRKKEVHKDMPRYADLVIWKQQEFNKRMVAVFNHVCQLIS
jgi:predicted proteasome-type protease